MRIGVNLMFLVPGEVGGSEPLLTNLVRAVAEKEKELFVFAVAGFSRAYPEIAERCGVIEVPWSSGAQLLRISAEHSWLIRQARKMRLDVLHHGVGAAPFIKGTRTVVTIHDIQYTHYPHNFTFAKRAWLRANVPFTARHANVLSPPSNFVKEDLVRAFDISPTKVHVVPFGSQDLFGDAPATAGEVIEKYELEQPFFYYPARTYPHKNHEFLIRAFAPLAGQAHLVLSGAPWFRDRAIADEVNRLGLRDTVRHFTSIPRRELAGFYSAATALVYPTHFEGFGAPVLEAMSLGCPVLSSNTACLPEVVGQAGILISPNDIGAWTQQMQSLLGGSEIREMLRNKGRERASLFSWDRSATLQIEAYEKAVA